MVVAAKPVLTSDEIELVWHGPPATPDDASITIDGRRLDTKVLALPLGANRASAHRDRYQQR